MPAPYNAARPTLSAAEFPAHFLELLDTQQQVDAAGALVYAYLTAGHAVAHLYRTLVTALVREDAAFHSFQRLEAAIQQHRELGTTQAGPLMRVAAARFLAAHAPTQRELLQTAGAASTSRRGTLLLTWPLFPLSRGEREHRLLVQKTVKFMLTIVLAACTLFESGERR